MRHRVGNAYKPDFPHSNVTHSVHSAPVHLPTRLTPKRVRDILKPRATWPPHRAKPARPDRALGAAVAMLGSLLLHMLLLSPILFGAGRAHRPPDLPNRLNSIAAAEDAMTLVSIDEPQTADSPMAPPTIIEPSLAIPDARKLTGAIRPVPLLTPEDADRSKENADAQTPDPSERAAYGRYLGQITARIERAWLKPRVLRDGTSFHCRVKIQQDRSGHVLQVELADCNADPAWQLSLVHAIESASPLPTSPDPDIHLQTVSAQFDAEPYAPGSTPHGYEPAL